MILKERETLLQEAEKVNQKTIQSNHAVALRQILHDGDNCPVCNGTYQVARLLPLPEFSLVDPTELHEQKLIAEEAQKAAKNAVIKVETILENLKQQELECRQEFADSETDLARLKQQISTALQADFWEADALIKELEKLQENEIKYHQALTKQKDVVALVRETQQSLDSATNTRDLALLELETATQEVERWQKQLQQIEFKLDEITGGKSYTVLQTELERDKQTLQKQLQEANKIFQAAEKFFIQCETETKEAGKSAEAARNYQEQIQVLWEAELVSEGFTEETFLSAQAESEQQTSWQKEIADYATTKVKLETQIDEVKSLLGERTTNALTIDSLRHAKNLASQHLQQAQD